MAGLLKISALGMLGLLAGCGNLLPSDEEIDQIGASIEERETSRITQEAMRDPRDDGFSKEHDVDPQFDPGAKRATQREAEAAGIPSYE